MRAHGSLIHDNRNYLLKNCQTPYLLMVDTDIVFRASQIDELFKVMEETGASIVTGLYREGYHPHMNAIFDMKYQHVIPKDDKPFEIGACGMGFCLIKVVDFTGENLFDPIIDAEVRHGEDVSFCVRARNKGKKIICVPTVEVDHLRLKPV